MKPGAAALSLRSVAICLAALTALHGCAGTAVKPAPLPKFKASAKVKQLWSASVGDAGPYVFTPAVAPGSVFAAAKDGTVLRVSADKGKAQWRASTKEPLSGGVGTNADLVMVATRKGAVLALSGAGKLLWKTQLSSEVLSAPRAAEGIVVVRSGDGKIYALDAASGAKKWEYQFTLPQLTLRSEPGVFIARGAVFVGLPSGQLVALRLADGAVGWDGIVAQAKGANELERISDVAAAPLVEESQVCAAAFQGRVACFDLNKGTLLWARDASTAESLSADPGYLYLTDDKGTVMAVDKTSGATIWKQDQLFARRVSAPAVLGNWVAVGDFEGYVHFLKREDGSFAARTQPDSGPITAPPVVSGDSVLLVQTRRGGLYALTVK